MGASVVRALSCGGRSNSARAPIHNTLKPHTEPACPPDVLAEAALHSDTLRAEAPLTLGLHRLHRFAPECGQDLGDHLD